MVAVVTSTMTSNDTKATSFFLPFLALDCLLFSPWSAVCFLWLFHWEPTLICPRFVGCDSKRRKEASPGLLWVSLIFQGRLCTVLFKLSSWYFNGFMFLVYCYRKFKAKRKSSIGSMITSTPIWIALFLSCPSFPFQFLYPCWVILESVLDILLLCSRVKYVHFSSLLLHKYICFYPSRRGRVIA